MSVFKKVQYQYPFLFYLYILIMLHQSLLHPLHLHLGLFQKGGSNFCTIFLLFGSIFEWRFSASFNHFGVPSCIPMSSSLMSSILKITALSIACISFLCFFFLFFLTLALSFPFYFVVQNTVDVVWRL